MKSGSCGWAMDMGVNLIKFYSIFKAKDIIFLGIGSVSNMILFVWICSLRRNSREILGISGEKHLMRDFSGFL